MAQSLHIKQLRTTPICYIHSGICRFAQALPLICAVTAACHFTQLCNACIVLQALAHASQQQQQQPQLGRKEVPGGHSAAHKDAQPATPLMGVLELGGASMQITYTPHDKIPATQAVALDLPGAAIWL